MGSDASTDPGTASLEIATRSGRVEVWAGPVAAAEVLEGDAELDATGRILGSGSGRVKIACPEGANVVIGTTSGRVSIGRCDGLARVVVASGAVTIGHADAIDATTDTGRMTVDSVGDATPPCGSMRWVPCS